MDDYALPQTAVLEPQASTPSEGPTETLHRPRRPEFYKPFHYVLLVYLFFYCSRISEMVPALHPGVLIQPILLIGMFMTSTTKAIFRTDIGRLMTAFTVWIAICVPFSVWKGGSFDQLTIALQALLLLFFMAAFIRSMDDVYRVMFVVAISMAAVGVLSNVIGGGREGSDRLGLGTGSDTLSDANFLALYLVIGLPLLWFAAQYRKGFMKVALIALMAPVLAGAAKTGSRMGLLSLSAGMLFFFIFATARQRILIIMGGTVFLACVIVLLPQKIMERFTTYFQASSAASEEAAESAETRKLLLTKSLAITAEHPLFGVGPGEFMDAEAGEAMSKGHKGVWHYTHNSYTELSSEIGIPGVVLFLIAFYRCYKGLTPIRDRYPKKRARDAALFLQIVVIVSAIGAFFLSIAYSGILYAIMGLSAALQQAAAREYKQDRPIPAPAQEAVA